MSNIPFFESAAFFILIGCVIGGIIGFVGAIIIAASGRASLDEENMQLRCNLERVKESLAKCIARQTNRHRKG